MIKRTHGSKNNIKTDTAHVEWVNEFVPKSKIYDDIYYAPEHAIDESSYVFLKGIGAPTIWKDCDYFRIGETGFGTGLNFLNTWAHWQKTAGDNQRLHYISIEASPLKREDICKALSPFEELAPLRDQFLHQYPPTFQTIQSLYFDNGKIHLTLIKLPINIALSHIRAPMDAWYLDGFAPSKNPEMWSEEVIRKIVALSKAEAPIATFTAAGDVKRRLEAAKCIVAKTKGFGKKRERILATTPSGFKPASVAPAKTIAIIGGGIAGATLANQLRSNGSIVTIYDKNLENSAKSKNSPAALISPKFILGDDPYGRFAIAAYLAAIAHYDQIDEREGNIWLQPRGLLMAPSKSNDAAFLKALLAHLNWPIEHVEAISNKSKRGALALQTSLPALWYPKAGSINTVKLFDYLKNGIKAVKDDISSLTLTPRGWLFGPFDNPQQYAADILIITGGIESFNLLPNVPCPLIANRGQTSLIEATDIDPAMPSYTGTKYLTAPFDHVDGRRLRLVGASYQRTPVIETRYNEKDHNENLSTLAQELKLSSLSGEYGFTGMRATTVDHMPIAGQVPHFPSFKKLPEHRQKILPHELTADNYLPNLYILTGLASRGFQTAPILSHYITSLIEGNEPPFDTGICDQLNPARFALKERKHKLS